VATDVFVGTTQLQTRFTSKVRSASRDSESGDNCSLWNQWQFFHEGQKISGDCCKELRFHIGRKEARSFYISQLGWYTSTFDNMDWGARDRALDDKPDMFKMWVFK
jgi:hypothetical protein